MYTLFCFRLSDLIGRNEEGVAWPPGLKDFRGGKKQDILKMVRPHPITTPLFIRHLHRA